MTEEINADIAKAVEAAEATPPPEVETMFSDVYEHLPPHLVEQRAAVLDQIRRTGAIADSGGKFPL